MQGMNYMNNFMSQFDTVSNSEAGAKLHFKFPNGEYAFADSSEEEPVEAITVTMLGASSNKHKKHSINELRKYRAEAKKKEKQTHGKGDNETLPDSFFDDTADMQVDRLVAVVTSWSGICDSSGEEYDFTPENVRTVFTKYQSLRVQAINFLDDDANFIVS